MIGIAFKNRGDNSRLRLFLDVNLDRLLVPGLLVFSLTAALMVLDALRLS